jgi:hypothetical protein
MMMSKIEEFTEKSVAKKKNSLYICAAGFEDRVRGIVETLIGANEKIFRYCTIMEYQSYSGLQQNQRSSFLEKNKENLDFLRDTLRNLSENFTHNMVIDIDNMLATKRSLEDTLKNIPEAEIGSIFVDISGMANFLILLTLHQVKAFFGDKEIFVLYSEAQNYFPEEQEATDIIQRARSRDEKDIIRLGELLGASGARETFVLPDFKGYFREDFPTCLIFFVGYEPSRAIGLLEGYRPNLVIACYGVSPHEHFKWRTPFSKELHEGLDVFKQYNSSTTEVSTFKVSEILSKLEKIYVSTDTSHNLLYESYNIAVTPQCSKLQTVATYLFCQSHPDVQVVFCLPGSFNPYRYSKGIGKKWLYKIPI